MSDTLPALAPVIPPAPKLQRVEVEVNSWHHTVPPGIDWREACRREYWSRNYERLRPGDSITIHSSDHRIRFAMLIMNVNTASNPVHLDAVFVPIWPLNLELPQLAPQRPPRYEARLSPGGTGFNVLDLKTGSYLRENPLARDVADNLAAALERARDQTAAETEALLGEFLQQRQQPARVPQAGGPLHVHEAGDSWEVHGPGCSVLITGLDTEEDAAKLLPVLSAPAAEEPEPFARLADVVRVVDTRQRTRRSRGRPRSAPSQPAPESPPMTAAPVGGDL